MHSRPRDTAVALRFAPPVSVTTGTPIHNASSVVVWPG